MNAADVLAQHQPDDDGFACTGCAWTPKAHFVTDGEEFGAHQLDALSSAGYAVVELPPMDTVLSTLDTMAGLRYYAGTQEGQRIAAALLAVPPDAAEAGVS